MSAGTEETRPVATLDLAVFTRFADHAVVRAAATREEVDALNVYPVPDGDTGTNVFLTLESARDALREEVAEHPGDLRAAMAAYARGALLGARGNSGVILSQLLGALVRRLRQAGPGDRSADVFADGMRQAADAAYAAVGEPVEGTILTVARAAADTATEASQDPGARLGEVVSRAAAAAREAVDRTPDQLPVLAQAGVVDAGGRALSVLLGTLASVLTGAAPEPGEQTPGHARVPRPLLVAAGTSGDLTAEGPAYEVMYLLSADDEAVALLRQELAPLGDSLVVVGGDGLWNVHVHVDDVGAAIEAGVRAGRPHRIRVTHFAEQTSRGVDREATRQGRGVVAVAAGPGLATLFSEAGAVVLRGGPGARPSTAQVLAAIEETGAAEVVVLPNDRDTVGVAEAAAREAETLGVHAVVVPTRAQVQGIAALAVHDPGRALDSDVVHMADAARGARHGAVTLAAKDAITMAGACRTGDALGVIDGDFVVVGTELQEVAEQVLARLLGSGGELVTLVPGEGGEELVATCSAWVRRTAPGVDVVVHEGGQPRYPLLLAVE